MCFSIYTFCVYDIGSFKFYYSLFIKKNYTCNLLTEKEDDDISVINKKKIEANEIFLLLWYVMWKQVRKGMQVILLLVFVEANFFLCFQLISFMQFSLKLLFVTFILFIK